MFEDLKSLSFFSDPAKGKELFLQIIGEDPYVEEKLKEVLPLLLDELKESPDPDMALSNLAHFSQMIISKMAFLSSLKQNPALTHMVITLFGHSQFLSDALIRNPEYFDWFIDSSILTTTKTREEMFEELSNMVGLFTTRESQLNAMRRFKRREMLRIGLRDLMKQADLETTTLELSYLADICVEIAQEICYKELQKQFGTPIEENTSDKRATFTTIGMGKLGGKELNYSSDIDVMFLYSEEGKTDGTPSISNHEFFTKLAQGIIQVISGMTKEGYLFRLDVRLRPEGDAGPLVRSLASYENYYASFGQTWERLALIKARLCSGDKDLSNDFLTTVAPFIYHKYTGYGEIEDLHRMKKRIDNEIAKKGTTYRNVKLGYGGIREIEFSVQILQLLYGAKNPSLKSLGTLACLQELKKLNFIQSEEESFLKEAYTFLRNAEHRLQILHEQQLHTFPEDPKELALFSSRMGFQATSKETSEQLFLAYYKKLTDRVHQLYTQFFKLPGEEPKEKSVDIEWLLEKKVDSNQLDQFLTPIGFLSPGQAHENLILLAKGPSYMNVSLQTQKLFLAILPNLLEVCSKTADPDQALNNLERFVLTQGGSRSSFYEILIKKPKVLELLVILFGSSQFLSNLLMANPDLFGIITLPGEIAQSKDRTTLQQQLKSRLEENENKQNQIDHLRQFKNEEMLRISLRDLLGLISLTEFFEEFSNLADTILEGALTIANHKNEVNLAIIGFGKLGGSELSYSSDLDITFVSEKGDEIGQKIASEVIHLLSQSDNGNEIYKVDARLRPDGDQGPLAPSLETYEKYYRDHSATWEKQALTRTRFICGNKELGEKFMDLSHKMIFTSSISNKEKEEIFNMRERLEKERSKAKAGEKEIKLGAGGIVDIEFAAQYLQLKYGHTSETLHSPSTLLQLEALYKAQYLSKEAFTTFNNGYLFLRTLENKLRIVNNRPLDKLPTNPEGLTQCAKRMGYSNTKEKTASEQLMTDLEHHTKQIRTTYLKILKP